MGVIDSLLCTLSGSGRNVVADTVGVFRENSENGAVRDALRAQAALSQFAAEIAMPRTSAFDALIDVLNRVPRPAMALGTLGFFVMAMVDPIWFASRMQGIALVPEPLWWLLGAIVGFYFGARYQAKGQDFQRSIASSLARARLVSGRLADLRALDSANAMEAPQVTGPDSDALPTSGGTGEFGFTNTALAEWRHARA